MLKFLLLESENKYRGHNADMHHKSAPKLHQLICLRGSSRRLLSSQLPEMPTAEEIAQSHGLQGD